MDKTRHLLIISVITLILIGISYSIAMQQGFANNSLTNAAFMELLPEECRVMSISEGVTAGVSFRRDKFGNITDKTYVNLYTKNIYAGANAGFCITAQNIADIPISVDEFMLHVDGNKSAISELIYFSGSVKIYRDNGTYYDVLGTFRNIALSELAGNLTSLTKYRKIDSGEKLVLELNQQLDDGPVKLTGKAGLSYKLVPVFIQYFPRKDDI